MNNFERIKKEFNELQDSTDLAYYMYYTFSCVSCPCFPCNEEILVVENSTICINKIKEYLDKEVEV